MNMAKTKKIYFTALETLKKEILNGKYPFQSKLPSEAELADDLNISGSTLRKVLDVLRDDGLIETRKGSGSFVCNKNINRHIPVILPNTKSTSALDELLRGIQDFLEEVGLISLPTLNHASREKEIQLITDFIEKGHKNFIIFPLSSLSNIHFYQQVMRKGVNLTFVDTLPKNITCDYVTCANFIGGYEATKKLIDLGHTDIAFCCFSKPRNLNTIRERLEGYLSALRQNGIPIKKENIILDAHANDRAKAIEFTRTTKATAVFAANDDAAFTLINKFREVNRMPAIIGFDNSHIAKDISLASVSQQHYKMGRKVAELLYNRMINPNKDFEHIRVPVTLIERESLYGKT